MNPAQSEAVNHIHGPCLVLAGAGSGKTRVITHKIARLIQAGLPPKRIFAITFTNKAAAEMRERARALVGKPAREVVICTFHALGVRLLREDGSSVGLKPNFSILDSDDVASILKDLGAGADAATARAWQWQISLWKNQGLDAAQAAAQARTESERHIARVMAAYHERLQAFQSVDFDDLIGLPLKMLQTQELVRQKWQALAGHLLVDEYQDTNATQYALFKALVGDPAQARFTAVGDDDQSIYGWRGATLDNLKKLPQDFPSLKLIKLEQNYRSTNAILRAANAVIGPNPKLFPKSLWSTLGEGEPVRVVDADTEEHEAERVVARIQSLRAQSLGASTTAQRDWRDFAVLYRANHQAKPFEKALRRAQIPYKVSGGTSFFDRSEIKDLCAWFRLWINNDDDPAFMRAVTTPRRGVGHQTLAQLGDFAARYRSSLFGALFAPSLPSVIKGKALELLHEFGREVNALEFRARHTLGAAASKTFLLEWLQAMRFEQYLLDHSDSPAQAAARWTNVQEFCDWMAARAGAEIADETGLSATETIKSLLEVAQTVSLISTLNERDQDPNVVTLSTLHAAKGLEWPHVCLVGVTEGVLPFKLREVDAEVAASLPSAERDFEAATDATLTHVQEERRLMYVGITRAQQTLAVSWTRKRKKGREMVSCQPSRFIAEMALDAATVREDPRAKLKALRAEFAQRAQTRADPAAKL
ncbi:MAG: UvrD-helicase domain-containing protein [Rhodoferax sp.]